MGVIVRNGNAYGGFDKDFTVVESLASVESPKTEHLYAVGKKLYYHDGQNWIRFLADGDAESKDIEANENQILIGDGENWAKGSFLTAESFLYTGDWSKYSGKRINKISVNNENRNGLTIFSGSNGQDLSAPLIGLGQNAKLFFEDYTDVDISGNTKIYIHEGAMINIDSEAADLDNGVRKKAYNNIAPAGHYTDIPEDLPYLLLRGNPIFHMENSSQLHLSDQSNIVMRGGGTLLIAGPARSTIGPTVVFDDKCQFTMDDFSTFKMMNSAVFLMQGFADNSSNGNPNGIVNPSPTFVMNKNSHFIMDSNTNAASPIIVIDDVGFVYNSKRPNQTRPPHLSGIGSDLGMDMDPMLSGFGNEFGGNFGEHTISSIYSPSIQLNGYSQSQYCSFKFGGHTHLFMDGDGIANLKIAPESNAGLICVITPENGSVTDIKIGSAKTLDNKEGRVLWLVDGDDIQTYIKDRAYMLFRDSCHIEMHEKSVFSMRGNGDKDNFPRDYYNSTQETDHVLIRPSETSSSILLHDVARFIMKGERSSNENITGTKSTWLRLSSPSYSSLSQLNEEEMEQYNKWLSLDAINVDYEYDTDNPIIEYQNSQDHLGRYNYKVTINYRIKQHKHEEKIEGSPILELIENSEIRAEGTGSIIVKTDSITINGMEFTNSQLEALKQLIS